MSARSFAALSILGLGAVASAIGVVYARHESRRLFVQLSQLEAARDELDIEFGRLQLEQATWAESSRIEQIARGSLGMVYPDPARTRVVRR